MAAPTFPNIPPGKGSSRSVKHRILIADFGDGYTQPVPDGVNTRIEEWSLTFDEYPSSDVMRIVDLLDECGSTQFFYWTPPGAATSSKWRQEGEYDVSYGGHDTLTLKVKIKRVYDLAN